MRSRTIFMWSVFTAILYGSCSPLLEVSRGTVDLQRFEFADSPNDGWIRVREDSLWGFYHPGRRQLIIPQLLWAGNFHGGYALIQQDNQYFLLNEKGRIRRHRGYDWAYGYTEGKAAVQHRSGWFGYLDTRGKWVIRPQFEWALPFDRGQAIVVLEGRYGLIGEEGEMLVPPGFDEIRPYSQTLYLVRDGHRLGLLDRSGRMVLPARYQKIELQANQHSLITAHDGRMGLLDPQGRIILPVEFSKIRPVLTNGFRFFEQNGAEGLLGPEGTVIIPARPGVYEQLGIPSENRIAVRKDGKWGYLDFAGKVAIPFVYDHEESTTMIRTFRNNRAWTSTHSHFILLDTLGRTIREIPRNDPGRSDHFDQVYGFINRYAFIQRNGTHRTYGFIDRQGEVTVVPEYTAVGAFSEHGIGWVGYTADNGTTSYRLVDTAGNPFNSQVYSKLEGVGSQYLAGTIGKKKMLIDRRTGEELDSRVSSIQLRERRDGTRFYILTDGDGQSRLMSEGLEESIASGYRFGSLGRNLLWVFKSRKSGLADYQGRHRIPSIYDNESGWSEESLFTVKKNQGSGVIDTAGRVIIPLRYNNVYIDARSGHIIAHGKGDAKTDLFDLHGRPVSIGEWDYIAGFYGLDYAYVRLNGKLGVVDIRMNLICPPMYDNIGRFYRGSDLAWVVLNKKVGYINRDFELAIPIVYDRGEPFANEMVRVEKDRETLYLDRSGKQIWPSDPEIKAYEDALEAIESDYARTRFSS